MTTVLSLGVDIGSISTKGVLIDGNKNILASGYVWTEGSPVSAVKSLLDLLKETLPKDKPYEIFHVGTTGSARRLVGAMLGAGVIKNEITAHAVGTLSRYPDARTVLEIGGQDSKIILLKDGIVVDYAMNSLCAAGTGAFLSSQATRLGINVADMGGMAVNSKNPVKIAARCSVFAESDMVHKAQVGHKKEDLVAGLCNAVAVNYLSNVGKGKKIEPPVIFQGGVSKNIGVKAAFSQELNTEITVDADSHLMGALGVAILAQAEKLTKPFSFEISSFNFKTGGYECKACANNCEIVTIHKDSTLLDSWGNRCERGFAVP